MTAALPKPAKSVDSQPTKVAASSVLEAPSETQVLLEGVTWETYKRLLVDSNS